MRYSRAVTAVGLSFCAASSFLLIHFPWHYLSAPQSFSSPEEYHHPKGTNNATVSARYAYAFLVAGVDPDKPAYRYFLYNILVAARLLHETGSTADIGIFLQLRHSSPHQQLPQQDLQWLHALNITKIQYIPKDVGESYYRTQFDKFRILEWTEYDRVLFLDADVMPTANLDYLFSFETFKENIVVAGPIAPANGGFFVLQPDEGALQQVNAILELREQLGKGKGTTQFDKLQGWGHTIQQDDYWETRQGKRGREWEFYAAFADQGLLYHWVKYAKKNVSIVIGSKIEQWGTWANNGTVRLEQTLDSKVVLQNLSKPLRCWKSCLPIYGDHVHFGGGRKPWLRQPPSNLTARTRLESAYHLWFWTLMQLNEELDMGLDFANWTSEAPPLGMVPKKRQASKVSIRLVADNSPSPS
jgi:hypothetical protein